MKDKGWVKIGFPLLMVEWVDTTNIQAWSTLDEISEWAVDGGWVVQNVGFLVYEDDNCVVLAARSAFDATPAQAGLYERIPKQAIQLRVCLAATLPVGAA